MRLSALALILTTAALRAGAAPLAAQQPATPAGPAESRAERFMRYCDEYGDRNREQFCEVRDVTVKAPARALLIDGRDNGSVRVYGWDKTEVLVRALISTSAEDMRDAQDMARDIKIEAANERIRADGPSYVRRRSWSVSYEIWVPKKTSLDAETTNGSVSVQNVEGRMDLRAQNGSISLRGVSGDVRGTTSNGSVNAELDGASWKGEGLDLTTSNGSVNLDIPKGYNARLETGTVNGGMTIDFPITIQGSINRRISTTLGSGGPRVRAVTTNGGVRIRER